MKRGSKGLLGVDLICPLTLRRAQTHLCSCCVLIAWQSADFEIKIDLRERLQPTFLNQIRLQYLILSRTCGRGNPN